MKFFYLVFGGLRRKKLRTVLTMLSIMIAFVLFGALCAIKLAFTAGVEMASARRLMVIHKVSFIQLLPESYKARIEKIPGVTAVSHMTWFGGVYQDPKNFMGTFPVVPENFLRLTPEVILPEDQKKAWLQTRVGAIAGSAVAKRFGWKIGDRIPFKSPIWFNDAKQSDFWEFELVGIYEGAKKSTDTTGFYFRYDYFDEVRRAQGKGLVGWYSVEIDDANRAAEVGRLIDAEFANSPYETKTQPEGAMFQGFASQIGDIGAIMIAVLSAVFFTILLVAGNTMAQSVRERTEELGVLKAMGFTNERVLALVLAESCLIASMGGFLGLLIAWLVTLGGSPVPQFLPIFYVPTSNWIVGAGLVVALGLVAGIIPALQAMRLQIAVALRRQA
jgi:putative ABC transport system permease protein